MNITKIIERAVVTFIEAGAAYLSLNSWNITNKAVIAGAVGAGISAVYNVVRQLSAK